MFLPNIILHIAVLEHLFNSKHLENVTMSTLLVLLYLSFFLFFIYSFYFIICTWTNYNTSFTNTFLCPLLCPFTFHQACWQTLLQFVYLCKWFDQQLHQSHGAFSHQGLFTTLMQIFIIPGDYSFYCNFGKYFWIGHKDWFSSLHSFLSEFTPTINPLWLYYY